MKRSRTVATVGAVALAGSLLAIAPLAFAPAAAQEPVVVFTSDFEDGTTQGWFGRGPAEVAVSDAAAQDGELSLLTTDRADTWQGPGRDMRDVLQPGVTYEIEAFVLLADAPAADLHLSVQRRPAGGDDAFERVASDVAATDADWVRVAGSYAFASEDNDELQLYFESPDPDVSFYLDSVRITTTDLPAEVIVETGFEDGTTQGWGPRGDDVVVEATQADANTGEWSLLATGRADNWQGTSFNLTPFVEPGVTYGLSFHLKIAPGQDPQTMRMSMQIDSDGESDFQNLTANEEVTADDWVSFSTTWTPASAADAFHVYAESAGETEFSDFFLDDFTLTGITPPDIEDIPSLHEVLGDHFPLGAAIDARETAGPSAELLTRHFNSITAENHMKPEAVQPVEGTFTFEAGDELVDFAEANGMRVYGHVLVWHSQTPDWFFEDADGNPLTSADRDLLLDRMETHINTIAAHYGDRLWAWDVVNEAIDESQEDGLRRSPWYNIIGPDYLDHAFHFAREAFGPDVKLFINDFNTEFPSKREALFDVVSGMLDRGVPVDGVGHQFHVNLIMPVANLDASIERFRELPVDQAVTELDVAIQESATEQHPAPPADRVVRQGYYYRDLFEMLRTHDDVLVSVTAWGLHDGRSWLRFRATPRPWEAPLFFDDQLQSKPAYWGVVDPDQLPHFPQAKNAAAGTPEVDGERDLLWELLPGTRVGSSEETSFQVRWDEEFLYVLAEVADDTVDAGDRVDLYLDDTNAKAGDYTEGDAHYTVARDGTVTGGATAEVTQTEAGYRVEAALPLLTAGDLGRQVGFDIRVTDGDTGGQQSWSDQGHDQDTDTSRWGTLTFTGAVSHVDIPYATTAPVVDASIDAIWETAPVVRTEVTVEGDPDGAKADVRLLWDEQRLYVLAEVADPSLDASNSNPWEQDSIEIFVDPTNSKAGPFQPDDGQYRINFENHQTINGDLDVIGEALTSAAAVVDGGYLIEATIELDTIEPAEGTFIGLEFQVNDGTGGARTAVHTWHDPTGQSFQNTSGWGVGRFVAADEEPGPTCDDTISGNHYGPLTVDGGTLCLAEGSAMFGPLTVRPGASLVVTGATVYGPISTVGADTVLMSGSKLYGPLQVTGSTGQVELTGNRVFGPVNVVNNHTGDTPIVVSGNTVFGPLSCSGNQPPPVDAGSRNTVAGPKFGQCRNL